MNDISINNGVWVLLIAFALMLFPVPGVYSLDELPADRWSVGDKALLESAGADGRLYQLWPGDGGHEDDPLKSADDHAEKTNVLRIKNVITPSMMMMKPVKPDGRSVVVFPGGGYGILAAEHEGSAVGTWLNGQGITAFVVKYRVPRRAGLEKHVVALQDAQRAIRIVRANAKDFGIDENKIGVMGFSAGGHLAALTCHQYDSPAYEGVDDCDKVSCRPDFAILIYPAYLQEKGQLDPMVEEVKEPGIPMYVTISGKDKSFVKGDQLYVIHLTEENAPVEYHQYATGGHGAGLGGFPWVKSCELWLKDLQL